MCRHRFPSLALAAALFLSGGLSAGEVSRAVDCLPDAVVQWAAAEPDPGLRFGASLLPGIILGPPGSSLPLNGSTSVASLGAGGSVVVAFNDIRLEDRPGPDFIVFENSFYIGFTPVSPQDPFAIFAEPGVVQVSADGENWFTFPYDADALVDASGTSIDLELHGRLVGLAGITPTFAGAWIIPNDPTVWDPAGQGGISGAGGDAFDLADVGLPEARYVRILDGNSQNGVPGAADGFDLDAVVVLHGRPVPAMMADQDGDRLSDSAELLLYGTNPADPDSDGDGVDDGREAAGCRDPAAASSVPWMPTDPALWVQPGSCTELRWTFVGTGETYDLVRGDLGQLGGAPAPDLGPLVCLVDENVTVRWTCDADPLAVGEGWFYLVRIGGESGYGHASNLEARLAGGGCP